MDLQQSPLYLGYIQKLKWHIEKIDDISIIYRHIFLIGGLAKLQRSNILPSVPSLKLLIESKKIRSIVIEPAHTVKQTDLDAYTSQIKSFVHVVQSPYLPTKTRLLDLQKTKDEIFNNFSEAKRRAVRRAEKNGVIVSESDDIQKMKHIKSRSAGFLGGITTYGLQELWESFGPTNSAILLASTKKSTTLIGGVFLIFWEDIAYYWLVGATSEGKKLFAPTLLVWEAIKLAKDRGASTFDFVGLWDERNPKENKEWLGFTKFKEGFGGKILYYPIARLHK